MPKKAPIEEPKKQNPNERRKLMYNMFKTETSQNATVK